MNDQSLFNASRLRSLTDRAESFLLWMLTILLLADVLLGILARYVQFQVVFADELGKYLFIWLCAVGISAATKDDQHVRLTFIASRLPLSATFIRVTSQSLFLIFSLMMFYLSARLSWMHFVMSKTAMGFPFPMYLFTAALPSGFMLTSIRLIQDIAAVMRKEKKKEVNEHDEYAREDR